jgi:hypothetical protein
MTGQSKRYLFLEMIGQSCRRYVILDGDGVKPLCGPQALFQTTDGIQGIDGMGHDDRAARLHGSSGSAKGSRVTAPVVTPLQSRAGLGSRSVGRARPTREACWLSIPRTRRQLLRRLTCQRKATDSSPSDWQAWKAWRGSKLVSALKAEEVSRIAIVAPIVAFSKSVRTRTITLLFS